MSARPDIPDDGLRMLLSGRPNDLDADQLAELETALNENAELAEHVAHLIPARDSRLAAALDRLDAYGRPTPADWDAAWSRINAAAPATAISRPTSIPGALRLWKPLAAVAAGLLLTVTWQTRSPAIEGPWSLQLGHDVQIDNLEVADGLTAFVLSTGDNGIDVIWVLEDES